MANHKSNSKKMQIAVIVSTLSVCFSSQGRSQETVAIDFSQAGNAVVLPNQAVSSTQTSNGPIDDQLVKNLGMRLERTVWSPAAWAEAGRGKYSLTAARPSPGAVPVAAPDSESESRVLDNIIAQGALPVICLTGETVSNAAAANQTPEANALPANMNEYQQTVKDGLNQLKSRYPDIQYVEVWNEPDVHLTAAQYDTLYRNVSQSVQAVNAALPAGERPLLIGGPAVYSPGSTIMGNFISFVRANNLELDFLSWHEYGGDIRSDAQTLQTRLSSVGLNPDLPQFVTDWGYTSSNTTSLPTPNELMAAASYVARGWTELETNDLTGIVTAFPSAENDSSNYSRSMFVPYSVSQADGQMFPLYNVYQMMSMQKGNRVASRGVSGTTSSLFPLATEDGSGVALMLTNVAGSDVNVTLNNLPSGFQQGAFQFTEYLVDATHSNWAYNQSASTLQQVANSTEGEASSFSTTLTMAKNSVALLMLTPSTIGVANAEMATSQSASALPVHSNMAVSAKAQASTTSQTVINYPSGFASHPSQIVPINQASFSGSTVMLTSGSRNAGTNVWASTPVNVQSFTTTFTWTFNCTVNPTDCGNGMGFIIMGMTNPYSPGYWAGWSGSAFAWASNCPQQGGTGCTAINSMLVKFDMYGGSNGAPGQNLTGIYWGGAWPQLPLPQYNMAPSGINMQSGHVMSCTLSYNGTVLTEAVTDTVTHATYTNSYTVNIPALVGGNTGYVGFGAGTGAATVATNIDSWTYTAQSTAVQAQQVATPTFSVAAGTYTSAQSVTISDGTSGATIYYTTNGTTPTTSSSKYTAPIAVSSTETLEAIAVATGSTNSAVASATYTITAPQSPSTSIINYPNGFASHPSQIVPINGSSFSGSTVLLTNGSVHAGNNVWASTPVNVQKFTTTFNWTFNCTGNSDCGDGMGFIIIGLTNPDSPGYWAGWSGSGFSWADNCPQEGGTGCVALNSILVKFDLYGGPNGSPGQNLTGLYSGGQWPQPPLPQYSMASSGINMQSGHVMSCTLSYNGSVLTEKVTDTVTNSTYTNSYTVNIPALVAGTTGYVGFGGGTGGATVTTNIDSWTYTAQ
jgi:hypothetical protein